MLDTLAGDVDPTLESGVLESGSRHERLPERRFDPCRMGADHRIVDRNLTPSEDIEALGGEDRLDGGLGPRHACIIAGQECKTRRVMTDRRKVEIDDLAEKCVGDLDQDAGTIAGVDLGPSRTTMIHVAKRADAHADDLVAPLALHVHDETDAAGIMFESGVVETLRRRETGGTGQLHTSTWLA